MVISDYRTISEVHEIGGRCDILKHAESSYSSQAEMLAYDRRRMKITLMSLVSSISLSMKLLAESALSFDRSTLILAYFSLGTNLVKPHLK